MTAKTAGRRWRPPHVDDELDNSSSALSLFDLRPDFQYPHRASGMVVLQSSSFRQPQDQHHDHHRHLRRPDGLTTGF